MCSVHGRLGLRPEAAGGSRNAYGGSSRLFVAAMQQQEKPALGKFDARQKLSAQNASKVVDARQKLLQKTKFADARERIDKKKLQAHRHAASDMRTKLLAKRRLGLSTSPAASAATAVKQAAAGQQLTKTTPVLVTVSNQRRMASALMGDTSTVGSKTANFVRTSRLVMYSCIHRVYIQNLHRESIKNKTLNSCP